MAEPIRPAPIVAVDETTRVRQIARGLYAGTKVTLRVLLRQPGRPFQRSWVQGSWT